MVSDHQNFDLPVKAIARCDEAVVSARHAESTSTVVGRTSQNDRRLSHERLLGAKEVAHWLGVSRAWVFEHSNGRRRPFLPSVKLGKSVRYRPVDVDAFIIECERFSRRGAA
jgi:predicted DNA-binding transcriptional regulator AlpA